MSGRSIRSGDLDAWRALPAAQQPDWPDPEQVRAVTAELAGQPPLVFAGECDQLKDRLAAVARGEAFVLQGGDCAETFSGSTADAVRSKLKTLLQMAVVLTYAASVPVVKIGRMAGQFAKPRSRPTETRDGVELPAYRGDAVNGFDFTPEARRPDPARLLHAYHCAAVTLNLCRAFTNGGYADLHEVHAWNQDFVAQSPAGRRYEQLAGEIDRALAFMKACGADPEELHGVEFYSSHEGLLLDYERALTRIDSRTGLPYDVSAHLVWIGERTRDLDGAHVEFFRQHPQPDRRQARPDDLARRRPRAHRAAQPRAASPAGSRSSPGWAPARSATFCRRWWRRSPRAARPSRGSATRCTATRSRRPAATRPAGWTTCSTRWRASSRCTARSAPTRAASTSSSPATT